MLHAYPARPFIWRIKDISLMSRLLFQDFMSFIVILYYTFSFA